MDPSRGARMVLAGAAMEHGLHRAEDDLHLAGLVGIDVWRIHVVHDGAVIGFKQQQFAGAGFRTVNAARAA